MGWIRNQAILLVLLCLVQIIPTFGDDEVNRWKKLEPKPTIVERSSHLHARFLSHICAHHAPIDQGFWIKKLLWEPRWVKTWEVKQIYVVVWKEVWDPTLVNKWIPVRKPSCGWVNTQQTTSSTDNKLINY